MLLRILGPTVLILRESETHCKFSCHTIRCIDGGMCTDPLLLYIERREQNTSPCDCVRIKARKETRTHGTALFERQTAQSLSSR